jgi:hypothetical protein
VTPLCKTARKRNKAHLAFVAAQPCLVCQRTPCDPHHLKFAQPRTLGRKVSDEYTVPLCPDDDRRHPPRTNIEWLWILDLAELSWEILRYRCLKQKTLESFRQVAIEAILRRLDGSGIPDYAAQTMLAHTRRNAQQWREDPVAAAEIEGRLCKASGEPTCSSIVASHAG